MSIIDSQNRVRENIDNIRKKLKSRAYDIGYREAYDRIPRQQGLGEWYDKGYTAGLLERTQTTQNGLESLLG